MLRLKLWAIVVISFSGCVPTRFSEFGITPGETTVAQVRSMEGAALDDRSPETWRLPDDSRTSGRTLRVSGDVVSRLEWRFVDPHDAYSMACDYNLNRSNFKKSLSVWETGWSRLEIDEKTGRVVIEAR